MIETEETPLVKAPAPSVGGSGLLLLSLFYMTSGCYTIVTVFTADGIVQQPGFSARTVHIGETMLWIGAAVSTAAFLPLCDIYGRRDLLFLAGYLGFTAAAFSLLAASPGIYIAAQFGIGIFLFPTGLASWVLVAETISPKLHTYTITFWNIGYSLFNLVMAAGSFGFKHTNVSWRLQTTLWYLPMAIGLVLGPLYISESPEISANKLMSERERTESGQTLRSWPMCGYVLATVLCWSAVSMSFYCLSYSSSSLSPDIYLNMALLAIFDIAVYAGATKVIEVLSPRGAQLGSLSCCAVLMLFCSFLPPKSWPMMFVCLLSRMCVDIAFSTIFLLIVDVFPAPVRATALGGANVVARVCTAFGPVLAMSPAWLCCLVMSGVTGAAAAATWTLPKAKAESNERSNQGAENAETPFCLKKIHNNLGMMCN